MPIKKSGKDAKERRWEDLQDALCTYSKCLFVDVDNVTSKQISIMRKSLRDIDAKMIMGKNTLMRASIKHLQTKPEEDDDDYETRMERWADRPHLSIIADQLKANVGLIFTNKDLNEIKDILDANSREAPARVGQIAPANVTVPPGPTGLDPKQTGFFQALSIQTKIAKAQIEIVNPVTIIKEGDKVSPSQAALLDKLKIRPFEYKMHIKNFLDNGKLFDAKVLAITPESILEKFKANAQNMTALSLGSGYIIPSAAPHLIMKAFKNLAAVGIAAEYDFAQLAAMKSAAAAGPATAAPTAVKEEKAEEKPKEEEKEESDGSIGFPFGDEEY